MGWLSRCLMRFLMVLFLVMLVLIIMFCVLKVCSDIRLCSIVGMWLMVLKFVLVCLCMKMVWCEW